MSAINLIIQQARQQAAIQKQQNYRKILREGFQQHKQILIAPIVSTILTISRLIMALVSECTKSEGHARLFCIGYFIAFISSVLTLLLSYVLPLDFYKEEFHKNIRQSR